MGVVYLKPRHLRRATKSFFPTKKSRFSAESVDAARVTALAAIPVLHVGFGRPFLRIRPRQRRFRTPTESRLAVGRTVRVPPAKNDCPLEFTQFLSQASHANSNPLGHPANSQSAQTDLPTYQPLRHLSGEINKNAAAFWKLERLTPLRFRKTARPSASKVLHCRLQRRSIRLS